MQQARKTYPGYSGYSGKKEFGIYDMVNRDGFVEYHTKHNNGNKAC